MTAGKGFESDKNYDNCTISFMNIPNIHVIRKSLEALKDACVEENWLRALDTSGWLEHIFKVLKASLRIVHSIHYETLSVLVHCSDGWDRTAQLTSLSMLMMDPYYRSLKGFMVLIEKEWVSFGHKFCDRSAWGLHGWKDEEYSPIFQQFIDCVYQIMHQHPCAFEFNEDLLLFIVEHTYTGWYLLLHDYVTVLTMNYLGLVTFYLIPRRKRRNLERGKTASLSGPWYSMIRSDSPMRVIDSSKE